MDINQILELAIERKASDIHLVTNYYPAIRIDGALYQLTTLPLLTKDSTDSIVTSILNDEQKESLYANKELDIGYEYKENRFRVNLYYSRNTLSASFRLIPKKIKSIEELELPSKFNDITEYSSGLVLVTGPTGEGKSTTLAALINKINLTQSKHIVTIEDPIEFVFPYAKAIVTQRELHQDTHSWSMSLRSVLREDPDVIFVGEIRDFESAQHVLTIAETGHLVFSTLHTISAPETISRLIDMFPSTQQNQIRTQFASVLRAVITQRLLPRQDIRGRIASVEMLFNSPAVSTIIRDGKPFLLDNVLQTSEAEGMIYFEKYLAALVREGKISAETANTYAIRPKELKKYLAI
ncbi:MAG: PilT/PilU family type 4a pilus ATPase [Patescibacteria group bacterium]